MGYMHLDPLHDSARIGNSTRLSYHEQWMTANWTCYATTRAAVNHFQSVSVLKSTRLQGRNDART